MIHYIDGKRDEKMTSIEKWLFNEMDQVGADFENIERVHAYDERMSKVRNFNKEIEYIVNAIDLKKEHVILEFGSGTGNFTIAAAKICTKVYAVDISSNMLTYLKNKAKQRNIKNIITIQSGFLNYQHKNKLVDAIITNVALHHLPDFWKMVSLYRMNKMIKSGGKLFIGDVIFSFPVEEYKVKINNFINNIENSADPGFAEDAETHMREEFSSFDWVIEGMLKRCGFTIDKIDYQNDTFATFICTKKQ